MKKKLLLSSVAALTLFAAYNTASAQDTYGVESTAVDNLLKAFEIKAPTTVEEVQETADSVAKRQTAAEAVREKNDALTKAKEVEANAEAEFKKAQEDFYTASKNHKLAKDTAVAAAKKLAALVETEKSIKDEKGKADAELKNKKDELGAKAKATGEKATGAYSEQEKANDELKKAKSEVEAQYRKKPVSTNNVEAHKEYQAKKAEKEAALKAAEKAKKEADEKVAKLEKEISKLEEATKKSEKELKVLADAITALTKVTGEGVVNGVTLKQLDDLAADKAHEVAKKQDEYVNSSAKRERAQVDFDLAVENAKDVYKNLNVEFKLEDVLAVDTPTPAAVTKFGWNKNEKGEWTYVLDSEGKLAEGWVNDAGSWYYLDPATHVMKKWWVQVDGTWYYLNGSGVMQTGWLNDNGTWYYLEASGALKVNQWFEVGGKWYHVDPSGALSVNTVVDGFKVNENGEWV